MMEAWEELAPELPPGPCADHGWPGFERVTGITRKRYAELIAPGLVRKAAIEKHGESELGVSHTHGDGIHAFEVLRWGSVLARGIDYDLCDAAWACIQALGGGE